METGIHTHICHHVRESVALLALRVFVPFFLLETAFGVLLAVFLITQTTPTSILSGAISTYSIFIILISAHIVVAICLFLLLMNLIISWAMTEYYLTEKELIILRGIAKQDQNIYDLTHTRTIKLHQSFFGRIFNYGTIELTLAGSGYHETAWLRGIIEPKRYEEVLRKYIQER